MVRVIAVRDARVEIANQTRACLNLSSHARLSMSAGSMSLQDI